MWEAEKIQSGSCGGVRAWVVRSSVPVCPAVGKPGGEAAGHPFARVGMMGFAVAPVDGVNQDGATSPVSFPQAAGTTVWGS